MLKAQLGLASSYFPNMQLKQSKALQLGNNLKNICLSVAETANVVASNALYAEESYKLQSLYSQLTYQFQPS